MHGAFGPLSAWSETACAVLFEFRLYLVAGFCFAIIESVALSYIAGGIIFFVTQSHLFDTAGRR